MTEKVCTYPGNRDETLVAYLYDDIAPAERAAFDAHLATCAVCRDELAGFSSIRSRLATWMPPEPVRAFTQREVTPPARTARVWAAIQEAPAWAQLAAAMLVLGVSAGAANLNIKYNDEGLSVRTGWSSRPSDAQPVQAPMATTLAAVQTPADPSVSRDDLMELERRLKSEIDAVTAGTLTVQRANALIAESERKQQNDLALHLAGVVQDGRAQRRDLDRIDRKVAMFESNAAIEFLRQRGENSKVSTQLARLKTQ